MHRREGGFTLIEVLVALAISTMVVAALYRSLTVGWRGLGVATRDEVALAVAKERLAAAGIELPLAEGTQSGQAAAGISWSTEISRYVPSDLDETEQPTFDAYWVRVTVGWRDATRKERTLELKSLKLQRRP